MNGLHGAPFGLQKFTAYGANSRFEYMSDVSGIKGTKAYHRARFKTQAGERDLQRAFRPMQQLEIGPESAKPL
jgi:hypothetical protein